MMVNPTLEGGLVIEPQKDADWEVLEMITQDAGRPAHLAESLADLMDEESEWEELVAPELADVFGGQCRFVSKVIEHAREQNEAAVFIKPHDAEKWYGAVNQARLALEARYELEEVKERGEPLEELPTELRSACFRDRFYLTLLSLLLDYVIEA